MKKILLGTVALIAIATAPAMAQQTIKIGFISTFSGPVAAIGADMRNAFELGLDHHGRKLGGLPVEVIYEDDQTKPEVGVQKTQKLIESDKVDFVVGYIWSNVLLASLKPLIDSKTFTIVTNAGGKDMLEGVSATFKGQIIGRELTRWPDQLDFSAELSKARAARPDAIFAFYPGGPGIQFLTQYAQSGLKGQIPLYTAFTIDALSLPRL